MDKFNKMVSVIDQTLNTREKRHIVGGVLMSVSLLFGGLAITVMSLRNDDTKERAKYIIEELEEERYE